MSDLKALVSRLHPICRRALEQAAERCNKLDQFTVELEHFLLDLVENKDTDLARILRAYDIDRDVVVRELTKAISGYETGNARTPVLSAHLTDTLKEAWNLASLDLAEPRVRSGAILRAALENDSTRRMVEAGSATLASVPRGRLAEEMFDIVKGGVESTMSAPPPRRPAASAEPNGTAAAPASEIDDALAPYTTDLTAEAQAGRIDPIVGRDEEVRQVIDVLLRRRQNNPILTGDAGVGKTAIVEGFARRVIEGRVPAALRDIRVLALDLGALQAGAGMRGEFEHRLQSLVEAITASVQRIVLFIDEAHMLIGAGAQGGQGGAGNLLKPALARGSLRTIAATTWGEYKKYIEKDPALARRFQVIRVAEPTPDIATEMLRGLAPKLESHHGVRILEEGLAEAARLSHRYITGRQLPDNAISVLDTACAHVAITQSEEPPELQDMRYRATTLTDRIDRLSAEQRLGADHEAEIETLAEERDRIVEHLEALESHWRMERETVDRMLEIQRDLGTGAATDAFKSRAELEYLNLRLQSLQEDRILVSPAVDARAVAAVVAGWTGIPVGRMLSDSAESSRQLLSRLKARIVSQDPALETVCRRVQTYYAQLGEPSKPTGVFLLVGPSGVGKTETAACLADMLFGGEQSLITVNMSEYQEAHSISGLKGAPPGYVGYGQGGVMTEAVRRRPYSVLLLDEIEKAHRDVIELFYQVFDKGVLEDSEGQLVDFRNTVVLATSNVGSEILIDHIERGGSRDPDLLAAALRPALLAQFPAAFLGRLTVVPYAPLGPADLRRIAELKLARIVDRFTLVHKADLSYDSNVLDAVVARATETESGARTIDAIISETLLPGISGIVLDRIAGEETVGSVHIRIAEDGGFSYEAA
jgi:type VI secretion system protein VasG